MARILRNAVQTQLLNRPQAEADGLIKGWGLAAGSTTTSSVHIVVHQASVLTPISATSKRPIKVSRQRLNPL